MRHGDEEKPEAALDLRLVRFMAKGGESGPAVVAGKLADSLIWKRVAAGEMPPKGKGLSDIEKQTLSTWIEQGAKTVRPEPETIVAGSQWTEEERSYWAFQPVKRPAGFWSPTDWRRNRGLSAMIFGGSEFS
jgi:Planctomycete cytochrome C